MRIIKLISWVESKHRGQVRKYTDEPYLVHCLQVASQFANEELAAAALCHDVLEDTNATIYDLEYALLGAGFSWSETGYISGIVDELTDKYTKKDYPELNRKQRKVLEADRLRGISEAAFLIKLEDYKDNINSIKEHDPDFYELYQKEKDMYIPYLKEKYGK